MNCIAGRESLRKVMSIAHSQPINEAAESSTSKKVVTPVCTLEVILVLVSPSQQSGRCPLTVLAYSMVSRIPEKTFRKKITHSHRK